MAEVLMFHHAQGQTPGFHAFADELRGAGHIVHTPDLFDGRTFGSIEEGVGFAGEVGFGELIDRGVSTANGLPDALVYAGFSLVCSRPRSWPRPGRVPAARCCSTRVLPSRSSGRRGRMGRPCRSTAWMPTPTSSTRGTSMPPARSLGQPSMPSSSSIRVTSTTSPIPVFLVRRRGSSAPYPKGPELPRAGLVTVRVSGQIVVSRHQIAHGPFRQVVLPDQGTETRPVIGLLQVRKLMDDHPVEHPQGHGGQPAGDADLPRR